MNDKQTSYSYDPFYLTGILKLTRFLFHKFIESGYDFFDATKRYMEYSPIRQKMDQGNCSALNKGINQLYHSVDFTDVPKSDNSDIDGIMSDWIADVYVYIQWRYQVSSADLVRHLPPEELCQLYYPLHETSLAAACEKLYQRYNNSVPKKEKNV